MPSGINALNDQCPWDQYPWDQWSRDQTLWNESPYDRILLLSIPSGINGINARGINDPTDRCPVGSMPRGINASRMKPPRMKAPGTKATFTPLELFLLQRYKDLLTQQCLRQHAVHLSQCRAARSRTRPTMDPYPRWVRDHCTASSQSYHPSSESCHIGQLSQSHRTKAATLNAGWSSKTVHYKITFRFIIIILP